MNKEELIAAARDLKRHTDDYMTHFYEDTPEIFTDRQWTGLDSVDDALDFFLDALDYYND